MTSILLTKDWLLQEVVYVGHSTISTGGRLTVGRTDNRNTTEKTASSILAPTNRYQQSRKVYYELAAIGRWPGKHLPEE